MLHRHVKYLCIYTVHMSPALNGSSVLQRFKHSNTIEICNGMILPGTATYESISHTFF